MQFPIRINKYLEEKGLATRRGADDLISKGLVTVNGRPAVLGYKVKVDDKVEIISNKNLSENYVYLLYNKPRGLATEDINIKTKEGKRVPPLGRLDKESEGLIILSTDGRLTDRLLNPKYQHEKEYEVEVKEKVSPMHAKILEGVPRGELKRALRGGGSMRAKKVEILGPHHLSITLTEGKKHQIRRMLDGAHLTVQTLKRVRIMDLKLGSLAPGKSRLLSGVELKEFLAMLY